MNTPIVATSHDGFIIVDGGASGGCGMVGIVGSNSVISSGKAGIIMGKDVPPGGPPVVASHFIVMSKVLNVMGNSKIWSPQNQSESPFV